MQATIQPGAGRSSVIAGAVLMIIGGAALVSQLFPDYNRYLPLAIGLGLVAVFAFTRNYAALVFAGILTGLGVGLVAAQAFPSEEADGVGAVLGLGLGFISIWVVGRLMHLPHHHFWPLIPGGILSIVGFGLAAEVLGKPLGELFVPSLVVLVGVLFVIGGVIIGRRAPTAGT
jgi:hypothetical protein